MSERSLRRSSSVILDMSGSGILSIRGVTQKSWSFMAIPVSAWIWYLGVTVGGDKEERESGRG